MTKFKAKCASAKQKTKIGVVSDERTGKLDVEKAAWSWIETLNDPLNNEEIKDRHVRCAYRLDFPLHSGDGKGTIVCKKNCKQNPRCYCQIGRERWLQPSTGVENLEKDNDSNQNSEEEDDGTEFEKRPTYKGKDGQIWSLPVGLKNLGNTCYVNSFLQIWFHNVQFRRAIYR